MTYLKSILPSVAILIGLCVPGLADDKKDWAADAARGQVLAERLCATCHVVGPTQTGAATAGPPTFASIANRPGQTRERILNVLIAPHPPMPNVQMTLHEIDDIIAYLDTMRSPQSKEPLLPVKPNQGLKPVYPEPS
ncbi:MAG: cytochrome c [Pseudomonadota bacterium]